ncbi:YggT family protein [Sphingomonas sp. ASV193]|uniref:YggT family protein n=1 Tax=Sphingomonas sp. ASV193 TaxID=3144405 RepID=UPI0032E8D77C
MVSALFDIVQMLLQFLTYLIFASVIVSWLVAFRVLNTSQPFVRSLVVGLDRLLDPLYRPVRRILPDFGGIDFSPLVVLLLIAMLRRLLAGAEASLLYGAM